MIRSLHIKNFAVIEDLSIEFSAGLNILTGETGAGKSILIEALGFLLGARGTTSWLRDKECRLAVEGVFDRKDFPVGLTTDFELSGSSVVVRRELDSRGKTRATLNGKSIPIALLSKFGDGFVDFHGQHEHQNLLKTSAQLSYLDRCAAHAPLLEDVRGRFEIWTALNKEKASLDLSEEERTLRIERLRQEVEEIDAAALTVGEEEELAELLGRIKNSGKIRVLAAEAYQRLYDGENAALVSLTQSARSLEELARLDPALEESSRSLESARVAVEEVSRELSGYRDGADFTPERLDEIHGRQEILARLRRKYGTDVPGMLERVEASRGELASLEDWEGRNDKIEADLAKARKVLQKICDKLHESRLKAAQKLETALVKELKVLGMPQARFSVAVEIEEERFSALGGDEIEFLISVNPGHPLKPVKSIASGGELSRVMLALKTILAKADEVPVLVFDEVDAGIGGAVARAVGARLGRLGRGRQVLCVTHLAQVACFGLAHFNIVKKTSGRKTEVLAERLEGNRRLEAIAWMLGGREVTAASRKHAQELLESSLT